MDWTTIRSYRDSVNTGSITLAGDTLNARQGLLVGWEANTLYRNGYTRYTHLYRIAIADGVWDLELLDHGLQVLDSSNKPQPLLVKGKPTASPRRLDGSGAKLLPDNAAASASVFNTYLVRKEANWSTLSLPTTL